MTARRWTLAAVATGVMAALLATHPLALRARDAIATPTPDCPSHVCADHLFFVWVLGEGGRRLWRHPLAPFEANIFHPLRHALAYSESMLSAGALTAPVNALTGNPVLGFNLYFLASYVLSVVGTFLVVREITADPRAGLVAGWMAGLLADRWPTGMLPAISIHWAPFLLYAWLRFLSAPTVWRGLGLGGALLAQMHASAYLGMMVPLLVAPWALVLVATGPWPLRRWLASAPPLAAALGVGAVLYLPYLAVGEEFQYHPKGFFPALSSWFWGPLVHPAAYVAGLFDGGRRPTAASPLPLLLLGLAAVAVAVRRPRVPRPGGEGAHLAAALVLWIVAMAVCLGPEIHFGVLLPVPFLLLRHLPGFGYMHALGRFIVVAGFVGAIVAGIATAIVLRRLGPRTGAALVAILLAVVVVDTRTLREPMPLTRALPPDELPAVYRWLATTPPETAVLELPYGAWGPDDARYLVPSLLHGRRLVNGYSAMWPRFVDVYGRLPDPVALRALADAGVAHVIAHAPALRTTPGGSALVERLAARADLVPRWIGEALVLDVPPATPPEPPPGVTLDRRRWRLEASSPGAAAAADGDLATHWTAPTRNESFLRVDLGSEEPITGVTLRLGTHVLEYPRRYRVRTSSDGMTWDDLGGEDPTLPPFASYRRDHRDVALPLGVNPRRARWLEVRVAADPPGAWTYSRGLWAVHELVVHVEP